MPNILLPTYNANVTLHYTSCSDQKRLSRYACRQHSVITPRAQIMSSQHHRPEEVNMLFAMGIKQVKEMYCSCKKYVLTLCSSEHPLHYNTTHMLPHLLLDWTISKSSHKCYICGNHVLHHRDHLSNAESWYTAVYSVLTESATLKTVIQCYYW